MARDEGITVLGSAAIPKFGGAAPRLRNRQAVSIGWASLAIGVVSLAALLVLRSAYVADRPARAAIEATIAMSALTTMFLLYRRFTVSRQLRDVLLVGALGAVTAVEAIVLALLALGGGSPMVVDHVGAGLACQLLVAVALVGAALMPDRAVSGSPRRLAIELTLAGVVFVTAAEALQSVAQGWQIAVGRWASSAGASPSAIDLTAHLVAGVALLYAAFAFAKRSRPGDRQTTVLAVVAELLGVATLMSLETTKLSGAWVTVPDLFRLSAAVLIMAFALREYGGLVERRAISAERARMARDLHDGLAQDLAFIASHSGKLASELGDEHPLTVAARRALNASRGAIIDLGASSASSTLTALETVCQELERRYSIDIDVRPTEGDGSRRDDFDADSREHITRITREAIVNAVKHGRAGRITVELGSRTSPRLLTVSDDGRGIGEASGSAYGLGLGLEMIRARAFSLDARMVLRHRGAGGTELLLLRT